MSHSLKNLAILKNMKPIIEYQDYHLFIRDYYDDRKRRSYFSWREFAKLAGFASSTYLRLVSEGKSNLSRVTMDRMVGAMELVGYEVPYFKAMVNFCNAKNETAKAKFLGEMQSIALEYKVRIVDKEAVEYFDGWKNSVVRELAPLMRGATPGKMAKACCNEISAAEVADSLAFLTKAGFLKKDPSGAYRQTEKNVVASKEGMAYAVHAFQKKVGDLGIEAIERFGADSRSISGITLTVNRDSYERIAREIDEFRKRIIAIASDTEDANRIYQMNLQFFPMTWDVNEIKEV